MTYSCAIWGPREGGVEGDLGHVEREFAPEKDVDELEVAQMRKIRTIIARARLSQGDKVLEIGSGWGSFAIEVSSARTKLASRRDVELIMSGCFILIGRQDDWLHRRHSHPLDRAEGPRRSSHRRCWSDRPHHGASAGLPLPSGDFQVSSCMLFASEAALTPVLRQPRLRPSRQYRDD